MNPLRSLPFILLWLLLARASAVEFQAFRATVTLPFVNSAIVNDTDKFINTRLTNKQIINLALGQQHVRRDLDRRRPGPPRAHLAKRLVDQARDLARSQRAAGPLGQVAEQPDLVWDLVEQPTPHVDRVRLDLAGQAQHL